MALVMSVLLGGALMSLLAGQSLFYAKSDQIISAERNIRAAAELLAAEIRMAAPEDLVAATPDSVSAPVRRRAGGGLRLDGAR